MDTKKKNELYELVNELSDITSALYLIREQIASREEIAVSGVSKDVLTNAMHGAITHLDRVQTEMYDYCE